MGVSTSLHIVSTGKASLKTTIPVFIVKQFKLKKGDNLDWCIDMHNNEMVIIVKKIKWLIHYLKNILFVYLKFIL